MNIRELAQLQWESYVNYHSSRTNLLIHIIVVPLFIVGTISFILALLNFDISLMVMSIIVMMASIVAQWFGHSKEQVPAKIFKGPFDAFLRISLEQWVTFPKFVITGNWYAALRNSSTP